jgi:2-polyprenyl-6-methoxyphenol hydroxylase-like FAD-dependent oxidoreductase
VVACDGARSALRQLQGLALEGDSYHGRFVIADIRVDLPLPTERLAFFDPPWNPGNTVLMHREPQGIWRIDYQLPAGETPEQALDPASLKARIDAQLASVGFAGAPWEMDWCSVYSARALTLPDYVNGPVVYCGDAAHLLPIFGVRGANTGFQDAQNLAWKLAAVVQGRAPMALLHSYSTERVSRRARDRRRGRQEHPLHGPAHARLPAAARRHVVAGADAGLRAPADALAHLAAARVPALAAEQPRGRHPPVQRPARRPAR